MQKFSLEATSRELLDRAHGGDAGRAAATVIGGHEKVLRQTAIAMVEGVTLSDHENPGEASVYVLAGRVRLSADGHSWEGRHGDLLMVPDSWHNMQALEDSVVLLTVAKLPQRLTAPVLMYAGGLDALLAPETAAASTRLFPNATVTVQPGAAHFPWLDDPAFFTAAITSFLS